MRNSKTNRYTPVLLIWPILLHFLAPKSAFGDSGSMLLDTPIGARPVAIGAYTAVADDSTSLFWNPAGMSYLKKRELGLSHAELYGSSRLESTAYAHPTRQGTFAVGLSHLSHGGIESRDTTGAVSGNFSASESLFILGYARPMGRLRLGTSFKVLHQQIADSSANGFALDLGASAAVLRSLRLGLTALNIGPPVRWNAQSSQLPLTLSAGMAWTPLSHILISADIRHRVHENKAGLGLGLEVEAHRGFFLRAGYLSSGEGAGTRAYTPTLSLLRAGMGLRLLDSLGLDYSFTPAGEVGATQRLSMGYRF